LTDTVKVSGLEFAQVDDVAKSDLTEALKGTRSDAVSTLWDLLLILILAGVHIMMHVASPLPGRTSVDDTLNASSHTWCFSLSNLRS
jgi:hypothetical protein